MAQNRRPQTSALRFGPALLALLLCLLLGGAGVGYVWQKSLITQLGRELKAREQRLAELQSINLRLRRQLATLRSPRYLEQRVRELNLGLVPAQPAQILRLREPECWPADDATPSSLAAHPLAQGP